jgi:hypothetical protein
MIRLILALVLALPGSALATVERAPDASSAADPEPARFTIEDARAFVGIFAVKLYVGELRREGGNLVGDYAIRVPLRGSKNDDGRIVLPIETSIEELGRNGGVLRGLAHSNKPETPPNTIVCEVRPDEDQAVRLAITTPDRTINFQSRYEVLAGGDYELQIPN